MFSKIITLFLSLIFSATLYAENNQPPLIIFCSGGLMSTLQSIAKQYKTTTGVQLIIKTAPSMGNTPQSIPSRLAKKESVDVLVLVSDALTPLEQKNWIDKKSIVHLADSYIALAVKKGHPIPDIKTVDGLKNTLLNAQSIAYSDSASGQYISSELFKKLGIEQQVANKAHMIPATPVGKIIASGKAEIGFQQYSELKPIKDITIVGLIPNEVQKITGYSAAIVSHSQNKQEAKAFIKYLSSDKVAKIIKEQGLTPTYQ